VPIGIARISTSTPGGSFFAYAIVTDLNSQDSWEMLPFADPPVVFADGFEGGDTSAWTSVVQR